MPKFKVIVRWEEVSLYEEEVEVEAENRDEACQEAHDNMRYEGRYLDSITLEPYFDEVDVIEEDEEPVKAQRNLPDWF